MRHILALVLSLLLLSVAYAKDLAPNTGDIKLNNILNMHVIVGNGDGCAAGYNWNTIYGGCRIRISDLTDNEFSQCISPKLGIRVRSRSREQWILQGSKHVALSSWGSWSAWNESECLTPAPECQPHQCTDRAYISLYGTTYRVGELIGFDELLVYVQCKLYRNNEEFILRNVFLGHYFFGITRFDDFPYVEGCNEIAADVGAQIDYSSIDGNAKEGWARVQYH